MTKKKIWVIVFIIVCLIGIATGFLALHTYSALRISPSLKVTCNISPFFNCFNEVFSKFTKLFGIPIAFIYVIIYSFSVFMFILWFFVAKELKSLVISFILFPFFLITVLSIFVTFSSIVFNKNAGVFYPLMFIINAFLTLALYQQYKDYLKTNIFDKNNFAKYKKEIGFNKNITGFSFILVFAIGFNLLAFSLVKTHANLKIGQKIRNKTKTHNEQIEEFVNSVIKSKTYKINVNGFPYFGSESQSAIKIIKFSNIDCPYCLKFAKDIHKYMKKNKKKIKVYVIPINFDNGRCLGKRKTAVCLSVYASYIAHKKGVFEKFYNYIYLTPGANKRKIFRALKIAGISKAELEAAFNNKKAIAFVNKVFDMGDKYKIEGTPVVFINGKRMDGYANYKVMKRIIDKAGDFK